MIKSTILMIALSFSLLSFSQQNEIKDVTPAILQCIKTDINKKAILFKANLLKTEITHEQIDFSVDTFKIEQIAAKKIEIDYSTWGMNKAVNELTVSYDSLLNKYYQKLSKSLKVEDRKVLVSAQRAWMNYRDAEVKLISTMTNEEYSGGGSKQSNIVTLNYNYLVKHRAIEIFGYYDGNIKNE
jgi:uncharacterized protein YecT (DUF1311 family)